MANYFLSCVNNYRISTEQEVLNLREKLKNNGFGELKSFSYTIKNIKEKGEIVDTYYLVKAGIEFTNEKEPDYSVKVHYSYDDED